MGDVLMTVEEALLDEIYHGIEWGSVHYNPEGNVLRDVTSLAMQGGKIALTVDGDEYEITVSKVGPQ